MAIRSAKVEAAVAKLARLDRIDALFSGSLTADTPHHSRPAEMTSWKIGLLNQRACQAKTRAYRSMRRSGGNGLAIEISLKKRIQKNIYLVFPALVLPLSI